MISPSEKLFWEGALFAVAMVFEAEVLVNLKEGLVVPGFFEENFFLGAIAKEAVGSTFHSLGGASAHKFGVIGPVRFRVVGQSERVEDIGEKVLGALFAKEGDGLLGRSGGEGVVLVPKGVGAIL